MKTKLDTLKALTLKKDADFSEAVRYFLDCSIDESFMQQSKPARRNKTFYKQLVSPILEKCGASLEDNKLFLLHLKKYRFMHGSGILSTGASLMFYFFEDHQIGMATVSDFSGTVDVFRLTTFISQKPIVLSQASYAGSEEIH